MAFRCRYSRLAHKKMADVIFILKHLFYAKTFITFINATKVY